MAFDSRYRMVAGSFAVQAVTIGCLFSYGVFFKEMEAELGWSRTLLSASTSLAFLFMGILAIAAGRLSDSIGPRWVLTFTGVCTGVGYALMYFLSAPWQLLMLFTALISLGLSTHDVVTLSAVAKYFEKRRGIMTGVVKVGAATGQLIMPLVATLMIASLGWRDAFLVLGLTAGCLLVIAAQGFYKVSQPAHIANHGNISVTLTDTGLTLASARKHRSLWTFCVMYLCVLPTLVSIPLHIAPHASDLGATPTGAALVLSTLGASSILGRLGYGLLMDKTGGRGALMLCLIPLVASLITLQFIENPVYLYGFAALYGIAHGGLFTLISPTIAEFFGMRSHGAIFGVVVFFGTLGGAVGPTLLGLLYDRQGTYDAGWATLAILASVGLMAVFSLQQQQSWKHKQLQRADATL